MKKTFGLVVTFTLVLLSANTFAQNVAPGQDDTFWNRLGCEQTSVDSTKAGVLEVSVDALTFFRDNEYDTDLRAGYSLPGTWVRPTVNYNPTANIHLELGFSALFFDGANKYPNYAYHDIGFWKGNQYQDGAHLLPWLRAQMDLGGGTSFVLGNIYGTQNHQFSTPLYNDEQLLSADPEMGFQILHNGSRFRSDLYINWQSYQFELDTHQEAFTVGGNAEYAFTHNPLSVKPFASFLIQHRGGEQDVTQTGVQTIANGSAGLKMPFHERLQIEASVLACLQHSGHLWPFKSGTAYHVGVNGNVLNDVNIEGGLFYAPKNYANLYGSPFFSTVSLKHKGIFYEGMKTAYCNIGYSHTWAGAYTLGTNLETFFFKPGKVNSALSDQQMMENYNGAGNNFAFSFGVYMRINPTFLIKKY